jgi:hypothetical protein
MKTAVEWFEQKLDDLNIEIPFGVFEEAKEMFEEQTIKMLYIQIQYIDAEIGDLIYKKLPEEIYNETFKNQ